MIFGISKTTIEGVLSLLTTVCVALLALKSPLIGQTANLWLTLIFTVLTAVSRFIQNDTPTSTAPTK